MLAGLAADEAGLPADPGFRSAWAAAIEWLSRSAAAPPDDGAPARAPRWDWGPPGPPAPVADQDEPAGAGPAARPGPDEQVSFGAHIRPLFRSRDRQAMSFAFDLWSADDVRANAAEILARLANGSMPCDGAWSPDQIDVFRRWTQTGTQP
jgi:hypothetical protein